MERFGASNVEVLLRSVAPVKHSVIPYDTGATHPNIFAGLGGVRKSLGSASVFPR